MPFRHLSIPKDEKVFKMYRRLILEGGFVVKQSEPISLDSSSFGENTFTLLFLVY